MEHNYLLKILIPQLHNIVTSIQLSPSFSCLNIRITQQRALPLNMFFPMRFTSGRRSFVVAAPEI